MFALSNLFSTKVGSVDFQNNRNSVKTKKSDFAHLNNGLEYLIRKC